MNIPELSIQKYTACLIWSLNSGSDGGGGHWRGNGCNSGRRDVGAGLAEIGGALVRKYMMIYSVCGATVSAIAARKKKHLSFSGTQTQKINHHIGRCVKDERLRIENRGKDKKEDEKCIVREKTLWWRVGTLASVSCLEETSLSMHGYSKSYLGKVYMRGTT